MAPRISPVPSSVHEELQDLKLAGGEGSGHQGDPDGCARDLLGARGVSGRVMIHIDFSPDDCTPCPVRSLCTRAKDIPRTLTLQVRNEHEAIQRARQRQTTDEFATAYARRAGIEGTMSQGVRAFGLRQARYRGLAKVHLQDVATASAMNIARLDDWLNEIPLAQTRCSRFAALAHLN